MGDLTKKAKIVQGEIFVAKDEGRMAVYLDGGDSSELYKNADEAEKKKQRELRYESYRQRLEHNLDDICERDILRPKTGVTYTGPFNWFWEQATDLYVFGNFYACIALIGMTAEKICNDLIMVQDISINVKVMTEQQKARIAKQNFFDLIDTLAEYSLIDDEIRKRLHTIRKTRNKYVHVLEGLEPKSDCEVLMEKLSEVIISIHSVFNDYDIEKGMLVRKKTA